MIRKSLFTIGALLFGVHTSSAENYLAGDTNQDGKVTISDVVQLIKLIEAHSSDVCLNTETHKDVKVLAADVDNNGIINQEDLNLLVLMIMGKEELVSREIVTTGTAVGGSTNDFD